MRILFRCDEYPPAITGGIGSVTKIVAESLAQKGHDVFVYGAYSANQQLPSYTEIRKVKIYRRCIFRFLGRCGFLQGQRFSIVSKLFMRIGLMALITKRTLSNIHKDIQRIIDTEKVQIVEFPDYTSLSKYYSKQLFIPFQTYSIPLIARVHGSCSFLSYYRNGKIPITSLQNDTDFFSKANHILAVSRFSADFLKKELSIDDRIDVIYNPLDMTRITDDEKFKKETDSNKIVFVGKVVETKGAYILIRVFNRFHRMFPDYELHLIGGGNIDEANKLVDKDCEKYVFFEGYKSHKGVVEGIKSSTFCVIPSLYENFSMAAMEIMGLGKPLIYTCESSGPELINDGEDGLLVNPRSENEILSAMARLATDQVLRERIGRKARTRIASSFSSKIILDQLEAYYQSVIKESK